MRCPPLVRLSLFRSKDPGLISTSPLWIWYNMVSLWVRRLSTKGGQPSSLIHILEFCPSNLDAQIVQLFFELAPNGLHRSCGMDPRQSMHILVSGELRYSKRLHEPPLCSCTGYVAGTQLFSIFRSDIIYVNLPLQVFTNGDSKLLDIISCFQNMTMECISCFPLKSLVCTYSNNLILSRVEVQLPFAFPVL